MSEDGKDAVAFTIFSLIAVAIIGSVVLALMFGLPAYNRAQKRANANNDVKITHIEIEKAHQEAKINHAQIEATKAEAEKRVVEAHGLAEAQRIVDNTLTPLYVQHEAIQAQERIATSGKNNTMIYVPAGTNGTPIITSDGHSR